MSGFCTMEKSVRIMRRQKTLRERIETRIARKRREDVFLPREFGDLGGEDQVLRVLRGLVRDGRLVRLGWRVYSRAIRSRPRAVGLALDEIGTRPVRQVGHGATGPRSPA